MDHSFEELYHKSYDIPRNFFTVYPKNIFRFIWPVQTDKVDLKKSHREILFFLHFFAIPSSSRHEKCPREFFAYFNALETRGVYILMLCPIVFGMPEGNQMILT